MNGKHRLHLTLLACLLGSTMGCTTQAWYEGLQQRARNECARQPPGEREDCLHRLHQKPYDQYERERAAGKP